MLGFSELNRPSKGPVNLGRTLRINQPVSDVLGQLLAITLGWITPPPPAAGLDQQLVAFVEDRVDLRRQLPPAAVR